MARNQGVPHYQTILRHLFASWQSRAEHGRPLPSERALARQYSVARSTACRALNELRTQGFIRRVPGSGSYVIRYTAPLIVGFGYGTAFPLPHGRVFTRLADRLGKAGYRLQVVETGLYGEFLSNVFDPTTIDGAKAIVWYVSGHPLGRAVAIRARRRLPAHIPLVLINDPLGLSLQSRRPFDLVHYDTAQAGRCLAQRLLRDGFRHPVIIHRTDVIIASWDESERGFLMGLIDAGVPDAYYHRAVWNIKNRQTLRQLLGPHGPKNWRPDALILPHLCGLELRRECQKIGLRLPSRLLLIEFGQNSARYQIPMEYKNIGDVCADLLLSRLNNPHRSNLHVKISLPVRSMRKQPREAANA